MIHARGDVPEKDAAEEADNILVMRGVTKEFPGVRALNRVTFQVRRGEIHALVGENGAGKSTLMKVLTGVHPFGTYEGDILVHGQVRRFRGIRESEACGMAVIYQELALVKQLNIAENIFLGREITRFGKIDWDAMYMRAEAVGRKVGLKCSPGTLVGHLGVGEQQLVEIAKALAKEATILILDEPTAALAEGETERLMQLLRALRNEGVTCVYISHRLKEVFELADRITVLRDGQTVATHDTADLTEDRLIALMVGRDVGQIYPRRRHTPGRVVLEVEDWTVCDAATGKRIDRVGFQVREGEVLGMAGLIGAGRTELVMSLFGLWGRPVGGRILLDGQVLRLRHARDAIQAGISLASEDRKRYGLVLMQDVKTNITLASLRALSSKGVVNEHEEIRCAERSVGDLKIKTAGLEQKAGQLSGGNQQKMVLGKWLMTRPRVLILDEPTRGIDVGAKVEIYNIINDLVDQGVAILVISSELPEVLGLSDRILVMRDGRVVGEAAAQDADQETIMHWATGGH